MGYLTLSLFCFVKASVLCTCTCTGVFPCIQIPHTEVHTCMHPHTRTHTRTYTHTHTRTHTHTHMHKCAHMQAHTFSLRCTVSSHSKLYMYMYVLCDVHVHDLHVRAHSCCYDVYYTVRVKKNFP